MNLAFFDRCLIILSPFAFFFLPGGVTAQTIAKVGNAFFAVFLLGFSLVVTGVTRPGGEGGLVTVGAGVEAASLLSVIHGKGVGAVILRRAPGGGGVAL